MIKNITYTDKEHLINDTTIPDKNKVTDTDMNEIKDVVNTNAEELETTNGNVSDLQENKVDKVAGKGLSTNDFTNEYESQVDANTTARHTHSNKQILDNTTASFTTAKDTKLNGIETGANKTIVDTELSNTSTNPVENKVITERTNELEAENKNLLSAGYKLNSTGESVTLNKTSKNKFVKFDVKGNKKQDTYNGYNLYEPLTAVDGTNIMQGNCSVSIVGNDISLTASGADIYFGNIKATGNAYAKNLGQKMEVPSSGKIYLKISNTALNKNIFCFFDANDTSLGTVSITSSTGEATIPNNAKYCVLRIGKGDAVSGTTYTTTVMVSTTDVDYEPFVGRQASPNPSYPQEIYAVGDNGTVNTIVANKNWFDGLFRQGGWSGSATTRCMSTNGVITKNTATQYTISTNLDTSAYKWSIIVSDRTLPASSYNSILDTGWKTTNSVTVNVPSKGYMYISLAALDGTSEIDANVIKNFKYQIELGTTATTHTSHEHQTFTIPCQKPMVDETDYFDWDNKKKIHGWKKLVLDGTENWVSYSTSVTGHYRYFLHIDNIKRTASTSELPNIVCTHYTGQIMGTAGSWGANQGIAINNSGDDIVINDDTNYAEDTTAFKAWLAQQYANNTPVVVYYELATAEELNFTTAQNTVAEQIKEATSYAEQTNVFSTDNVSPNFDITAIADLNLLIDTLEE